jgi:N-acetylglucosamine kinase-like BadF-type ATPase
LTTSYELAEAFHLEKIPVRRVVELAPMVMAYASDDDVAGGIVDRLADEVVALARAALERLHLRNEPIEVLLGGGLLRSANGRLLDAIRQGINQGGTQIALRIAKSPPIVGAALLALDQLNVGMEAQDRLRRELGAAVDLIERRASDGRWDDA